MFIKAFWNLIKRILFRCDAETVHHFSIRLLSLFGKTKFTRGMTAVLLGVKSQNPVHLTRIQSLLFLNRVGLAAGFDKNGEILPILPAFGFGFAEIGTVTPRSQPGNPLPRLFRDLEARNLFNRMGFNNLGSEIVADRLRKVRASGVLPQNFRVGVNLGKNKDIRAEESAKDYALGARAFAGLADYFVINVSSPNTPGLRSLQTVGALSEILAAVSSEMKLLQDSTPLFLKLAPELEDETLKTLLEEGVRWGLSGFVLSNTLAGVYEGGNGGWSGSILTEKSRSLLKFARKHTDLGIISVGGISSPEEAKERLSLGADLVQIYSAWIFEGPTLPAELARSLT